MRIDVNAGSDEELRVRIQGLRIGPDLLDRIIQLRADQPFSDLDDLRRRVNNGIAPAQRLGRFKLKKLCVGNAPVCKRSGTTPMYTRSVKDDIPKRQCSDEPLGAVPRSVCAGCRIAQCAPDRARRSASCPCTRHLHRMLCLPYALYR